MFLCQLHLVRNQIFYKKLEKLEFYESDDSLYLTEVQKKLSDPQIEFHIEKARELLNYNPKFSLQSGLKEAITWYWKNLK